MSLLQNSNAISSGGYDVNNSLRFRSSASAYLSRTPASAGNLQKWTYSAWVKRGRIGTGSGFYQNLLDATSSGANVYHNIRFVEDNIYFTLDNVISLATTAVFRDPSAWYHVVVVWDTTNATAADRMIIYVNNVRQAVTIAFGSYPAQNTNGLVNGTDTHAIGRYIFGTAQYFDGYLAEVNFIDGQALTPSSFGATDAVTGTWQPKAYTGTYGTNGFYLKFSDIATTSGSNAGLGKDFSGNTNYWTTNNISVTSGTTYDAMTDSPTNTSATVANYAVMNPIWKSSNLTLAGANLNVTSSGNGGSVLSTIAMSSGKWYCEVTVNTGSDATIVGIANSSFIPTSSLTSSNAVGYYGNNGDKFVNGTQSAYGASYTTGNVIGIALDVDAGTVTFYKNNTSQGAITHGLTGPFYFATSDASSGSNIDQSWNFGQRPFSYTPPTGYVALNTYNLPTPTILQGNKYMDATLYTGTGSGSPAINNAGGFKPDLVWAKCRNTAAQNNILVDSVRGANITLESNLTDAEAALSTIASFTSTGFTTSGSVANGYAQNVSGYTYVGWQWQAGQGSTSSNTQGSITSTVSVNTTAGFSIVTYTGTGANATVGHGLGVAPKMVIIKNRTAGSTAWNVYQASIPSGNLLSLNSTAASFANTNRITAVSSTTFSIGTDSDVNGSTNSHVAYCWAEIAGFSKFGSYTGNGSTDGPFCYTGFQPKFIMIKRTDSTGDWQIIDTPRQLYNDGAVANQLRANSSSDESTSGTYSVDILSNGFKDRTGASTNWNTNGGTYIFMAFANNPFKNANAR